MSILTLKDWKYHQSLYFGLIKRSVSQFLVHFPGGYVNFIIQLCLFFLSIPIFMGMAFQNWVDTVMVKKHKVEDLVKLSDLRTMKMFLEQAQRDSENYKKFLGAAAIFLPASLVPY